MGARTRVVFHGSVGQQLQATTRVPRSWRVPTEGGVVARSVWQGHISLHRIRVLSPVTCGGAGCDPSLCQLVECGTREEQWPVASSQFSVLGSQWFAPCSLDLRPVRVLRS